MLRWISRRGAIAGALRFCYRSRLNPARLNHNWSQIPENCTQSQCVAFVGTLPARCLRDEISIKYNNFVEYCITIQ